uniref:Uncharacterized protein n=1 Tax=Ciona intestinalis TaxID=7719 RepID=H2XY04_CIOIN
MNQIWVRRVCPRQMKRTSGHPGLVGGAEPHPQDRGPQVVSSPLDRHFRKMTQRLEARCLVILKNIHDFYDLLIIFPLFWSASIIQLDSSAVCTIIRYIFIARKLSIPVLCISAW